MNKDVLQKKKLPKKALFTLDDYDALSRLLNHGYDVHIALNVITTKQNQSRINALHERLSEGEEIRNHLIDIPGLNVHFQFFYQQTSLSLALKQSIGMYRYEQQIKRNLVQTCLYPGIVMGFSVLCFLVMSFVILPMMMQLLSSMNLSFNIVLLMLIRLSSGFLIVFIISVFILFGVVRLLMTNQRQIAFFEWLNRYFENHILKFFHSYLWAGYWLEFQKQSCSTLDSLHYLKQMDYRPIVKHCSLLIEDALLDGQQLIDGMRISNMFSESLCFHFDVGIKCQQLEQFLEAYLEETKISMERKAKQLIRIIQLGSYVFVGMIVAVMSQVLFAPLDLLATMS